MVGIFTIPRYISQEKALSISAVLGIVLGLGAIFFDGFISVMLISLLGLAYALVFPAIWPMAIAGGAILPLIYGYLTDLFVPKQAYRIVIPCYIYILFFARKGYKIRKN